MSRYRGGPPTTLYVRNVSTRCRYDDLKSFFQNYGKILDITIPLDYNSGMPKGFCFIEFDDPRDAEEAQYRLDRKYFFGREIDVEFARGTRQTATDMRSRDSRFNHGDRRGDRGDRGDRRGDRRYEEPRDRHSRDKRSRSRTRSRSRSGSRRNSERPSKAIARRSRTKEKSLSRSKTRSGSRNRSPSAQHHQARSMSRGSRDQRSDSREMA